MTDGDSTKAEGTFPKVLLDWNTREAYLQRKKGERVPLSRGFGDGSHFAVRVTNINRFRYRVAATASGEAYFRTVPEQFKQFAIADKPAPPTPRAELAPDLVGLDLAERRLAELEGSLSVLSNLGTTTEMTLRDVRNERQARSAQTEVRDLVRTSLNLIRDRTKTLFGSALQLPALDAETGSYRPSAVTVLLNQLFMQIPLLRNAFQDALAAAGGSQEMIARIRGDLARLDHIDQAQMDIRASANHLVELINAAETMDYLDVDLGPYQVNLDNTKVTVTATEIVSAGTAPIETVDLNVTTTRGFKIDFSAGLLATTLSDFKYGTKQQAADKFKIQSPTSDRGSLATAAFTHFYWRRPGTVQLGLSLGIAVRDNPIYALGASAFFGRKQRLVLTAGLAVGKVSRLSHGSPGDIISSPNASVSDRYMTRPFFAISYNFGP